VIAVKRFGEAMESHASGRPAPTEEIPGGCGGLATVVFCKIQARIVINLRFPL
jgi:hypothetical protein